MMIGQLIKDCFTTKTGEDFDFGKIIGALIILAFLAFSFHAYILVKQAFDPLGFGGGAGGIFTSIGAHLFFKAKTEPGGEG